MEWDDADDAEYDDSEDFDDDDINARYDADGDPIK